MPTPLEKDIERHLGRMVGKRGGMCLKWVCPGWAGVPDRIVLMPGGRIYFVELKRSKYANVEELQKWWAKKLRELGFWHVYVKSHEDVKAFELLLVGEEAGL